MTGRESAQVERGRVIGLLIELERSAKRAADSGCGTDFHVGILHAVRTLAPAVSNGWEPSEWRERLCELQEVYPEVLAEARNLR